MSKEEARAKALEICELMADVIGDIFDKELSELEGQLVVQGQVFEKMSFFMLYGLASCFRVLEMPERQLRENFHELVDAVLDKDDKNQFTLTGKNHIN